MEVCDPLSPSPSTTPNPQLTNHPSQGVKQIKSLPSTATLNARYIFIAPPSYSALESRLRGRGTEKEESIQKRLEQAKNELEYSKTPGVHDIIIVNDDKERACDELESFVFGAKEGKLAGESVKD